MLLLAACANEAPVKVAFASDASRDVRAPAAPVHFRFPLVETELFELTIGVDHDPEDYGGGGSGYSLICTSYDGRSFPGCYDGHDGSDFILSGGFDAMDDGSATIVAAAPGVVIETVDGYYDRCHGTMGGVDCDGKEMVGNHVILEHDGGWRTLYWHMMTDTVAVAVGDEVECGDMLGIVGSSGYSSQPHLHFALESYGGSTIDPFAGEYSQPESWWVGQEDPNIMPADTCATEEEPS